MATTASMGLPMAGACAELLLADRKDQVYASELRALLRDVLERCVGAHTLSQLLPELSAASSFLYLALALGLKQPQQTLGEEFCDVVRVAKRGDDHVARHVSGASRWLWLLLAIAPKYAAERSAGGWQSLAQLSWTPRERMERQLRARRGDGGQGEQQSKVLKALDEVARKAGEIATRVETHVFPASYEFSLGSVKLWLQQAHLAAFYVFAKYLHVSNRLAGVQYSFVRSELSPGINLSLLVSC